ncbi:xanthine dehydrogenase accessory protein XdhC [Aquabacterium sp. A3]|uniref:xanthine dehydrogenase accessory protein XdhC n=1 Tax=Aquabacterium sp. A3 TaxID=3132829 RepID=UPI003119863D
MSLSGRALRHTARQWLAAGRPAIVVQVDDIKGSTPRETGTRMLVAADAVLGTIGGGHLEWQAIDLARHLLAEATPTTPATGPRLQKTYPLGPTLGQCCGGVVVLGFEPLNHTSLAQWPDSPARFHLELHGAGHVGQAIVRLLCDLDCTVRWIDERGDDAQATGDASGRSMGDAPGLPDPAWLATLPPHIHWTPTEAADHEVAHAPAHACHLVLTHRHDLDLRIISAVLQRSQQQHDVRFAGLIGSQTKRAKFLHRLEAMGLSSRTLAGLTCPIGLPELSGKEPAVIAVSVVAQLLLQCPAPAMPTAPTAPAIATQATP